MLFPKSFSPLDPSTYMYFYHRFSTNGKTRAKPSFHFHNSPLPYISFLTLSPPLPSPSLPSPPLPSSHLPLLTSPGSLRQWQLCDGDLFYVFPRPLNQEEVKPQALPAVETSMGMTPTCILLRCKLVLYAGRISPLLA